MKLSTGKTPLVMEFDNGDVETIYINLADSGLQDRLRDFQHKVEKKAKEIDFEKYKSNLTFETPNIDLNDPDSLLELSPGELENIQERLDIVEDISKQYNNIIKQELDEVFQSPVSEAAFKYCNPFDVVIAEDEKGRSSREMYIMHFLRWLMLEINKYGIANKEAIDKHLSKYQR